MDRCPVGSCAGTGIDDEEEVKSQNKSLMGVGCMQAFSTSKYPNLECAKFPSLLELQF